MKTIHYEFADGTSCDIEVDDVFYEKYHELIQEEKRLHWRETRRHVSLDYLSESGVELEALDADPLTSLIQREEEARLEEALSALLPKQRELLEKVFFENVPITEIAEAEGVSKQAIHNRLVKVYAKIKKLLI